MPRKNPGSTAATDLNGNASMLSSAPSETPKQPSPKQQKEQTQDKAPSKKKNEADYVSLDDLLLPRTLINRIARGVLPANTSIQRDAILALTKSATVFISHLAAEANEMTDRKTIQSADVLKALQEIEFAQVMNIGVMGRDGKRGGRIEREIEMWESNVRGKRRGYRDKVKARDGAGGADTTVDSIAVKEGGEEDEHQNKRRKRDSEEVMVEGGHDHDSVSLDGMTNGKSHVESKAVRPAEGDDVADEDDAEDVDDSEDDDEEDEQLDEEEGDEQEEFQDMEDSIDADGTTQRKHEMLAPDGQVEVIGSDDDDDESE